MTTATPTCPECLAPCELHNVTFCDTCHNHPGECAMGGCHRENKGGATFDFSGMERRTFCKKHSTHPHFGWLRAGGVLVETR